MSKNTILKKIFLAITLLICLSTVLFGCNGNNPNQDFENTLTDTTLQEPSFDNSVNPGNGTNNIDDTTVTLLDTVDNRVVFGKKYYYINNQTFTPYEYYIFNSDGSATYTHIINTANSITFHQIINFNWSYVGEGKCILLHNGTQIIKGSQDDAQGFCRVMHLSKNIVYWSSDGENTYFVSEDYVDNLTNYGKLIK